MRKTTEAKGRKVYDVTDKGLQIGNSPEEAPPFHELLQKLMREGARPTGTPGVAGKSWTSTELAHAAGGITPKTVGNWRRGDHVPDDLISLEKALFGSDPRWDAVRKRFRAAHEAAAKYNKVNPDLQTRVVAPQRFVGREMEIAALHQAITQTGAVAVVGPPGIGKTTLLCQVGSSRQVIERFGQRRFFVDLNDANNAAALQAAIVAAVGLDPRSTSLSDLLKRLGRQASLLVLANLEIPWERDMKAVQDCLCKLAVLPTINLVASLCGSVVPTAPVFSPAIKVGPLPPARAKELFLAAAPDISADDPYLKPLLEGLHGMPLAIELIACQAAPFKTLHSCSGAQ